ncbi:MAG: FAD binding domain-containing protein [Anaerolineales bacterium]|nr:FAD binding domain-containing protein [Anaerolineales bacterium]
MSPLEYLRPESLEEAIDLLDQGVPLAGGTRLIPNRSELTAVIDLQSVGLDQIIPGDGWLKLGAAVTLQDLIDCSDVPADLQGAARLEAGWNIRNMATLGGTIHEGDGRSALLTTLTACHVTVHLQPDDRSMALEAYLDFRAQDEPAHLVTTVDIDLPDRLSYAYAGRSPADRPMICAAAGWYAGKPEQVFMGVGGFGGKPQRIVAEDVDQVRTLTAAVYAESADFWASADYRVSAGGALAVRLFREVRS